jgi:hypothetical protein
MYPGPLPLHPNLPDVLGLTPRATGRPQRPPRRPTPWSTLDRTTLPRMTAPRGEGA